MFLGGYTIKSILKCGVSKQSKTKKSKQKCYYLHTRVYFWNGEYVNNFISGNIVLSGIKSAF